MLNWYQSLRYSTLGQWACTPPPSPTLPLSFLSGPCILGHLYKQATSKPEGNFFEVKWREIWLFISPAEICKKEWGKSLIYTRKKVLRLLNFLYRVHSETQTRQSKISQYKNTRHENTRIRIIHIQSCHADKKENQIILIYKVIQSGAVAKSYMRKGFLIQYMRK